MKLSGVKPRLALRTFDAVFEPLLLEESQEEVWLRSDGTYGRPGEGLCISASDYDAAWQEGESSGPRRLTPEGAALMIRMYESGLFELRRTGEPADASELQAYVDSAPKLRARRRQDHQRKEAQRERERHMIRNPSQVSEEEFTFSLLNRIFFEHLGPGEGELEVGGISVRKELSRYSSNSGKSTDHSVAYSWKSPEVGEVLRLEKDSRFATNRRNDPERNHGLPE